MRLGLFAGETVSNDTIRIFANIERFQMKVYYMQSLACGIVAYGIVSNDTIVGTMNRHSLSGIVCW